MIIVTILGLVLLIGVDQLTKYWASTSLAQNGDIYVWQNILHLTYVKNKGAAFGILEGKQTLLLIITAAVLIMIIFYYRSLPKDKWGAIARVSLVCVSAGAIGNFIDRALLGYVRDFIYFVPIDFPVFNVADILVVCGTVILVLSLFLSEVKNTKDDKLDEENIQD